MSTFLLEKILHTDSPSGNEKEIIDVIKANIDYSLSNKFYIKDILSFL